MRRVARIVLAVICVLGGALWLFLNQPRFGATPTGARLERIRKSPNFRNGEFQNLLPTPVMTGDKGGLKSLLEFAFNGNKRLRPAGPIPSVKRDLLHLPSGENVLVWFGHSSYFIQADGKRILVDPVLNGRAGPVPFSTKAFDGTDVYTAADIPAIDYLFITHDHCDHLDYDTVTKLRPKVKMVICGLGVGAHLERWGYAKDAIAEGDWGDKIELGDGFTAYVLPARHFSGRGARPNMTLWASFALKTSSGYKIYMSGDTGYGPHFKKIGRDFDGFDLALLECGQYDPSWKYIHMMPEETLRAAEDLHAALVLPGHNSKFSISNHDWDSPLRTITAIARKSRVRLITPVIGSVVGLKDPIAGFDEWWAKVR
jgi:L-ascorbate metabolism protein UlaG (beta-lactamase superfamily)